MSGWSPAIAERLRIATPRSLWRSLAVWQRRAIKTIAFVIVLILTSSLAYHYLIITLEGRSSTYSHSLQIVIETYTGTGYGSDSPWSHPVLNVFISAMDFATFLLLFTLVPYVFRPVIEQALSPTIQNGVDMSDHVVVCGVAQQGLRLVEEFDARDVEYVVIAESKDQAIELQEEEVNVIQGDPTEVEALEAACLSDAESVVIDMADELAASAVLAIRELDQAIRTVVLVEDLQYERHLEYAGADRVLTPRHILGRRIAERITTEIHPLRSDVVSVSETLSVLELSVFEDSPIRGESIEAIEAKTASSISIEALWQAGEFIGDPEPGTVVSTRSVLLVTGTENDLRELERETYEGREDEPSVVVAGYGLVGSTVVRALRNTNADPTVVDIREGEQIDIVGDVTEAETLQEAQIEATTVYVVTIADDSDAILSVLLAEQKGVDLDIIVRANDAGSETKLRRAGADYVLSLPDVSGRVLAREVLKEELLTVTRQLTVDRVDASPYSGTPFAETGLGAGELGEGEVVLLGVERGDEIHRDPPPEMELEADDELLVIGRGDAIERIK
jgi:Trk K+ transport system NAD-binding subunit